MTKTLLFHDEFKEIFQNYFDEKVKSGYNRSQAASEALLHAKETIEKQNNLSSNDESLSESIRSIETEIIGMNHENNESNEYPQPQLQPHHNYPNRSYQYSDQTKSMIISPIYPVNRSILSDDSSNRSNDQNSNNNSSSGSPVYNSKFSEICSSRSDDSHGMILRQLSNSSVNLTDEYEDFTIKEKEEVEESKKLKISNDTSEINEAKTLDITVPSDSSFEMDDIYNQDSELSSNINPKADTTLRMEQIYENDSYTFDDNPSFRIPDNTPTPRKNNLTNPETFTYGINPVFQPTKTLHTIINKNLSTISDLTTTTTSSPSLEMDSLSQFDSELSNCNSPNNSTNSPIHHIILDLKVDKPTDAYFEKLASFDEKDSNLLIPIATPPRKNQKEETLTLNMLEIFSTPVTENHFQDHETNVSIAVEDVIYNNNNNGNGSNSSNSRYGDGDWSAIMSDWTMTRDLNSDLHLPTVDKDISPSSTCFCM